jgi:hypothetical protein
VVLVEDQISLGLELQAQPVKETREVRGVPMADGLVEVEVELQL